MRVRVQHWPKRWGSGRGASARVSALWPHERFTGRHGLPFAVNNAAMELQQAGMACNVVAPVSGYRAATLFTQRPAHAPFHSDKPLLTGKVDL